MMHSNLTRWIEDADARAVFLQSRTMHEPQRVSQNQYIHLGQTEVDPDPETAGAVF